MNKAYPDIEEFSRDVNLKSADMIEALQLEREFHVAIKSEPDHVKRLVLYREIYTRVFEIYGFTPNIDLEQSITGKLPTVNQFSRFLQGAAILDAGCGSGQFALACAKTMSPKFCLGIDVFASDKKVPELNLEFRAMDITRFEIKEKFDVVMSDNVVEHLVPADLSTHLTSIKQALNKGGRLIVLTPNRLFGPWDVTRIIDYSYSGKTEAQGTHVNEMTFAEIEKQLRLAGFSEMKAVLPLSLRFPRLGDICVPLAFVVQMEKMSPLVRKLQSLEKKRILKAFEIAVIAS